MPLRVSPEEQNPTHHLALTDRYGHQAGLILCDDSGDPIKDPRNVFVKNPVDTTAMKQTSGGSSYSDYEYPYSPIVQQDWSGGRGGLNYEQDSTKFYDSNRARTGVQGKMYAGPQEKYVVGISDQNIPGNVNWQVLTGSQRYIYKRFTANSTKQASAIWLLVRRLGMPGLLTVQLYDDASGNIGALKSTNTVASSELTDVLSEWVAVLTTQTIYSGTAYWLVVSASASDDESNQWLLGRQNTTGSYVSGSFTSGPTLDIDKNLYYRINYHRSNDKLIPFIYKEALYATQGSELFLFGDRGTADSNGANTSKLYDATKSWFVNEWAGCVVKIISGTGSTENTPWRTVTSNTTNEITFSSAWSITHDTTTEYVIYGNKPINVATIGGNVTDVLVSPKGFIMFARGDAANIVRLKYETTAGVWTKTQADDGTNKATFLDYKPKSQKIVIANQQDGAGNTSIALADPVDWATASHTFGAAVNIDSKYVRITGTAIYQDESGNEAVWVFKEDLPYIVPGTGNPYPLTLEEMRMVRSEKNGAVSLLNGVYLFFTLSNGLERYYGNSIDDIGPNLGEGLPENRRGPISAMVGYPGKIFVAIDAGDNGYSSVLDSSGWHERYRAPKGYRITSMIYQVIPGNVPDRLWISIAKNGFPEMIYIEFPEGTTNELMDANSTYTHEFSVELSRMHAGLYDVMKLVRRIKLQTENLATNDVTGKPICWFELDYRLNEDTAWTPIDGIFDTSPMQEVDFVEDYGLAGKRLQLRVRGYTTDATRTPVLSAVIINTVLRTDVKYRYGPVNFRCMDGEPLLSLGEIDDMPNATDKQKQMEDWADASTDSMLKLESTSALFHDKVIFMNTPSFRQILFKDDPSNPYQKDVYVGTVSFQEA